MECESRRDGTLAPGIETVHFQKPCHFASMVDFFVVLALVGDVFHYSRNLRSADTTGEISFLPFEAGCASLIDPARRIGLEHLGAFGNAHGRRKREQRMYMIVHAADGALNLRTPVFSLDIGAALTPTEKSPHWSMQPATPVCWLLVLGTFLLHLPALPGVHLDR
jgi:hypothetical protein